MRATGVLRFISNYCVSQEVLPSIPGSDSASFRTEMGHIEVGSRLDQIRLQDPGASGFMAASVLTSQDPCIVASSQAVLKLVPKHWFSWDFAVRDERGTVADIDISWWRERGVLTVQGASHPVYRQRLMSGDFILESAGSILARAWKSSAFRRYFNVEHAGKQYTLRAQSAFRRTFVVLDGGFKIGSISPDGIFTRRASIDLPEDMPLPVRVFIVWLAVILWKRESDAGGAST
jgi:hypothetical protein